MRKNLSPRSLGFSGTVQSELIELALTYGFVSIDLDIVDFSEQVEDFGMEHARRLLDSAKLKIGNFNLPVNVAGTDEAFAADLARLPGLARVAADLGCARALCSLESANDAMEFKDNFEQHRLRLTQVAETLASFSVSVALDFDGAKASREGKQFEFIHDLDGAVTLANTIGAANVGVLIDFWQIHACGATLEDIRKVPVEKIVSVNVADVKADLERED
ncbi:MAG: sugar phosphate isomerase/epimerase [Planctomycetales bacterium]